MTKGLIHFYIGNGKGKSTALFGLAIRALGRNFKVLIIQVLKPNESGELLFLEKQNCSNLKIIRIMTINKFTWEMSQNEFKLSKETIEKNIYSILNYYNDYDIVLFDELLNAEKCGLIQEELIEKIILSKKESLELVFTGRNASETLKKYADYISIIESVKHPYFSGIDARIGIEY